MFTLLGDRPSSQKLIQLSNSKLVFKLINDSDGISRAKIASITKLSPTTISSLTDELINKGLVIETGEKVVKSSGRRPILLDVKEEGAFFVSVDLQEKGFNIALYNLKCKLIKEKFVELHSFHELSRHIIIHTLNMIEKSKNEESRLLGICIGAPGLIDIANERIISSTILPIEEDNEFCKELKERFPGVKIELVNESSLSAYAEKQFVERVKTIENLLYIDIHTGIGAGIIINGNIFRGANNLAGEFGHISVDIKGPTCKCGAKGCLETVANIKAIMKQLKEYDTIEEVAERYDESYVDVRVAVNKNAKYIAYGINNAVNLLNPEAVIIGGQIKIFGYKYLNEIIKSYKEIALSKNKDIPILLSQVEGNPVTLGGAKYMLDKILMR
ncbi:MAG: ROK family transcriptional regulator [Clostridia bacterium]|nr:ROK family transcriptional regulator [Clostridia bacterium]